ncbi:MAG: ribose-phosphate diphosphokinase [Candidatus Heimdallarchaeum endolithica]|uniref:ribose-phosphate diphosphokinase n=1 Tax=Candidatus Heimdallarchaeum endolithica TaxID=2876572 RepID=A0A9Y1BR37_9ARCH|nr:MAG: ribose-phosphate diphosphokinase [Candidatus Heimdallarchaeum endolithica]
MKIIPGPASIELAERIAKDLGLSIVKYSYKHFYDNETYLRVDETVKDEAILIIQSTHFPQEKHWLELFILCSTLKDLGASEVISIIPYLSYARADKRKIEGEALSHQILIELLEKSGCDCVITMNVHNPEAFYSSSKGIEKININLFHHIGAELKNKYKNFVVVGPDKGAEEDVRTLAKLLETDYLLFEKERDALTNEVKMKTPDYNFENKDVLLVDDIITSGGTAKLASKLILEKKPRILQFLCIHALSKDEVYLELKNMGVEKIISTNTIPNKQIKQLDIAPYIAKYIKEKFL